MQLQHTATLQVLHELSKMSRIAGKDAKSHLIKPDSFKDRPHGMDILTLQHTAAHCSTLQRAAAHCSTLQRIATHTIVIVRQMSGETAVIVDTELRNGLQHTAIYCNSDC